MPLYIYVSAFVIILASICIVYYKSPKNNNYSRPHVIFILADDVGWNDVSFHGSPQIPTPNLDALAASGIVLHNHYTAPQCTPSRASFLTGRNAIRTGLQHFVINAAEPAGLPLDIKTMPEYLKSLGYATHLIGKWHLGYYKKEYTPTYRGFDSFFGYWNGFIDYYDYTNTEAFDNPEIPVFWGVDLHYGINPVTNIRGKYATELFTEWALEIIATHDTSKPLFLYLSHLAAHTGNPAKPMQAPPEYVSKFDYIEDIDRRTYAGMIHALDVSIGQIFASLKEKEMLNNTILVFLSDNGGEGTCLDGDGQASNWPLRSVKFHLFEGGVRVLALVWSPLFNLQRPRISTELIHISDWLPTFYEAAGGNVTNLDDIDGYSMWEHFLHNVPFKRDEVLLNIDPVYNMSAIRKGNYKLIQGSHPSEKHLWYGPTGLDNPKVSSMDTWVWKNSSVIKDILESQGKWLIKEPDSWRANLTVKCSMIQTENRDCNLKIAPCLFNVKDDPCEYNNIADKYPEVAESLLLKLKEYNQTARAPLSTDIDLRGDPACHGFVYVPWQDNEYLSECPYLKKK